MVQGFHRQIAGTYHHSSYAHYGADPRQQSFAEVIWEIDKNCVDPSGWQDWPIISDTRQGKLELVRWDANYHGTTFAESPSIPGPHLSKAFAMPISNLGGNKSIHATILPPGAPGDQTVPMASADHQLQSGMFKGIFRQTGYEHQSSYKDPLAIASTLYSIVRIAQQASWKC